MHILISGGTGFIGSNIAKYFLKKNHKVTILSRDRHKEVSRSLIIDDLNQLNEPVDIVINLAGEPLDRRRWNKKVKEEIYNSRIQTTKKIVEYINNAKKTPSLFITASAVGFYGTSDSKIFHEEDKSPKNDFPSKLCYDWEDEAYNIRKKIRICRLRLGIVLGKNGGIISKMLLPFKLLLGARLGNGKQYMSWIHIDDVISAINFMIENQNLKGPFNMTAPNPVTNSEFTRIFAKNLGRISFLKLPDFLVKYLFGEMGESLLLKGQNVIPKKLLKEGYKFKYENLEAALKDITK